MQGIEATFDETALDGDSFDRDQFFRRVPLQIILGLILGAIVLAPLGRLGARLLHGNPTAIPAIAVARAAVDRSAATVAANPYGDIIIEPEWVAKPARLQASLEGVPFADPAGAVPSEPSAAAAPTENVPLPPRRDVPEIADDGAPLPPPRPTEFAPAARPDRRVASDSDRAAAAPVDNRNVFQKLFGLGLPAAPTTANKAQDDRVASAAPQGRFFGFTFFGGSAPVAGYDRWTAVYDISARTVYLPDGRKLEAHSGYGDMLDDPRYVSERMRGATPPHLYELEPREASFHGVQALRLKPIGEGGLFGRAGLLAHSYMLGPNGESNGCVSFKDYEAFLRAYQNGQVKRLAVVARL
jgi:hypothetical protein